MDAPWHGHVRRTRYVLEEIGPEGSDVSKQVGGVHVLWGGEWM